MKAGAKMGRPPVAPEGARASMFSLRLLPEERAAVDAAAKREELSSSEWSRRALVASAEAEGPPLTPLYGPVAKLRERLGDLHMIVEHTDLSNAGRAMVRTSDVMLLKENDGAFVFAVSGTKEPYLRMSIPHVDILHVYYDDPPGAWAVRVRGGLLLLPTPVGPITAEYVSIWRR